MRYVHAPDQQHQPHGAEQNQEHRPDVAHELLVQRDNMYFHVRAHAHKLRWFLRSCLPGESA